MDQLEGFVLIGGVGDGGKRLIDCEVYSEEDNVSIPPLPLSLSHLIAERIEATGAIIVAAGRTCDDSVSDRTFLLASVASMEWVEMGRMVQAVMGPSSVSYNGVVMVLGGSGSDGSYIDTIQCMDTSQAKPAWTTLKNNLPKQLAWHGSVVFQDTLVIVTLGGETYTCPVGQIVSDAGEVDWTEGKLPGVKGRAFGPGLGVVNDSLVVVFGSQVFTKSSVDSEWSPLPQLPQSKTYYPSIGNKNSHLVVAGGYTALWYGMVWYGPSASVYMLKDHRWEKVTDLNQLRYSHATVHSH